VEQCQQAEIQEQKKSLKGQSPVVLPCPFLAFSLCHCFSSWFPCFLCWSVISSRCFQKILVLVFQMEESKQNTRMAWGRIALLWEGELPILTGEGREEEENWGLLVGCFYTTWIWRWGDITSSPGSSHLWARGGALEPRGGGQPASNTTWGTISQKFFFGVAEDGGVVHLRSEIVWNCCPSWLSYSFVDYSADLSCSVSLVSLICRSPQSLLT
jgi:hypothetical protein